jgi:molybdopterin molybdotransferase
MNVRVNVVDGPLTWGDGLEVGPTTGAVVQFEGMVRPLEDGQPITALKYEAYEPMANRMMEEIAAELLRRYDLDGIVVVHGRGVIPVGQCAVRVRVAAAHRTEALRALGEFIERLKRDVPIWKSPVREPAAATAPRPCAVLADLASQLTPVTAETVSWRAAAGRVLAERLHADRDSPAHDVSAMDGYALRLADRSVRTTCTFSVAVEARIGAPPPALPAGQAVRIVTGAALPDGADVVIRREDVQEFADRIVLPADLRLKAGEHIRRRGENLHQHDLALEAGVLISPAVASALATFGVAEPCVRRRVRVGVISTGDELLAPEPYGLRDANGPALEAMLATLPWVESQAMGPVPDELGAVIAAVKTQLDRCDAVFISGGVSMGDRDYVPAAVAEAGCALVFHRLPIRPGRPLLGAIGPRGQAILGLPGNPVSVLVTARRFGMMALRRLGGLCDIDPPGRMVTLTAESARGLAKTGLELWSYRPVRLAGAGRAELVVPHSSGDFVTAARSDGFIEVSPNGAGGGPWPFYTWSP